MELLINVLWFVFVWVIYGFLAHRIAKRGERTGLFYGRVLVIALIFMPLAFVWVYLLRSERPGLYYERIPPTDKPDRI